MMYFMSALRVDIVYLISDSIVQLLRRHVAVWHSIDEILLPFILIRHISHLLNMQVNKLLNPKLDCCIGVQLREKFPQLHLINYYIINCTHFTIYVFSVAKSVQTECSELAHCRGVA